MKVSIKGQALRYLAQREHSRAELERKLRRAAQRAVAAAARATASDAGAEGDGRADRADGDGVDGADGCEDAAEAAKAQAGALAQDIAAALDDLSAKGFLSDERTATQLLASKAPRFGVNRLRRDMQLKGLDATLIASTLALAKDGEWAHAHEVWRRKFGQTPQDAKAYGQQSRFLAGRGFSSSVIQRILRGQRGDTSEPESDDAA
jgi:regulatory protein